MENIMFLDNDDKVVYVEDTEEPGVYNKDKRIFFGCRGTDPKVFGDIIDDANILKSILSDVTHTGDGGQFHAGFKNRSKTCFSQIFMKLREIFECLQEEEDLNRYEIIFCGHSLGGAAAAVTFTRMKVKKSKLRKKEELSAESGIGMAIEGGDDSEFMINLTNADKNMLSYLSNDFLCVTFASPSFGNKMNQAYCNRKKIASGIFNVVHMNDPVVKILYKIPSAFTYMFAINANAAIGNFKILFNDGVPERDFKFDEFEKVEEYILNQEFKNMLSAHSIRGYLEFFSKKNYGSTALDAITRTNNDMRALHQPYEASVILGEGRYGYVMKGVNKTNRQPVAIKKIKESDGEKVVEITLEDSDGSLIENGGEIATLKKLDNENVIKLYDFIVYQESKVYLVLELGYTDLHKYIDQLKVDLQESEISLIFKDLLKGLKALHDVKIIHRDIKPSNIIVVGNVERSGGEIFKIGDLGAASQNGGETKTMTVRGTKLYASPEIYQAISGHQKSVRLNPQTDIFSLGATMIYCSIKKHPWTDFDRPTSDDDLNIDEILNDRSEKLKIIIASMLKVNYKERPTAESILTTYYREEKSFCLLS